jgi:hypothetical protein
VVSILGTGCWRHEFAIIWIGVCFRCLDVTAVFRFPISSGWVVSSVEVGLIGVSIGCGVISFSMCLICAVFGVSGVSKGVFFLYPF